MEVVDNVELYWEKTGRHLSVTSFLLYDTFQEVKSDRVI